VTKSAKTKGGELSIIRLRGWADPGEKKRKGASRNGTDATGGNTKHGPKKQLRLCFGKLVRGGKNGAPFSKCKKGSNQHRMDVRKKEKG